MGYFTNNFSEVLTLPARMPATRTYKHLYRTYIGHFDVHPKAKRLHDAREVPFDGEARLAPPPKEKKTSSLKAGDGIVGVTEFGGETKVRDPDDFDVFRKGPGELWDGDESGVGGAKVSHRGSPPSSSAPLLEISNLGSLRTLNS